MKIDELEKKIENGHDIMLTINNKKFTILTWCEEGIFIDQQSPNDGSGNYYKTALDLINGYKVDGMPIKELISSIVIDYYS